MDVLCLKVTKATCTGPKVAILMGETRNQLICSAIDEFEIPMSVLDIEKAMDLKGVNHITHRLWTFLVYRVDTKRDVLVHDGITEQIKLRK